jgi:hypothetical protein
VQVARQRAMQPNGRPLGRAAAQQPPGRPRWPAGSGGRRAARLATAGLEQPPWPGAPAGLPAAQTAQPPTCSPRVPIARKPSHARPPAMLRGSSSGAAGEGEPGAGSAGCQQTVSTSSTAPRSLQGRAARRPHPKRRERKDATASVLSAGLLPRFLGAWVLLLGSGCAASEETGALAPSSCCDLATSQRREGRRAAGRGASMSCPTLPASPGRHWAGSAECIVPRAHLHRRRP